jgi:L-alanine-DL-glutamate epimerase-like enolase superfamily enzyme
MVESTRCIESWLSGHDVPYLNERILSSCFRTYVPFAPVIQPDIARCGGFTEARKIAAFASACGVTIAPHTGASGAVSIAAAVQWASSLSNLYIFEHMYTENPLRTEILKDPVLECHDAIIKIPSGPGLGIEIDKNKMKKYMKG